MNYIEEKMPQKGDTVVVGLSGGVDSSITALTLKEKGCNVVGVTMSLWKKDLPALPSGKNFGISCYGPDKSKDIEDISLFCKEHGIDYKVINLQDEFENHVLNYFRSEYRSGRTPNPCIQCNSFIKFGALLEGVKKCGVQFDYFCTGHYAKIVRPESGVWGSDVRPPMIAAAEDVTKDQTYFLYRVPSSVLEKVRFPLAFTQKKQVFNLARQKNLKAAEREESQDFIPSEAFDILFTDKPSVPGDIVDTDGKFLGRHRGIEHYTIGQRRGLGVSSNEPLYVHSLDAKNNLVVLSKKDKLFSSALIADNFVWPGNIPPSKPFRAFAKIRLASLPAPVTVEPYTSDVSRENFASQGGQAGQGCFAGNACFTGNAYKITFDEKAHAVTPGQSVVLYNDGVIIGGGIIYASM